MFEPTSIAELVKPWRLRLVDRIIGQVEIGNVDPDTALRMIEQAGMTADREALSVALAARALLQDRDRHHATLAEYEHELATAVEALATPQIRAALVPA